MRKLVEVGWCIVNADIEEDERGEYTYTGSRGNSVIDYVLGNGATKEEIERFVIGDKVDTDHLITYHHPLEVDKGWQKDE